MGVYMPECFLEQWLLLTRSMSLLILIIIKQTFQSRLFIIHHGDGRSERQPIKLKSQFLEREFIVYAILRKYVSTIAPRMGYSIPLETSIP